MLQTSPGWWVEREETGEVAAAVDEGIYIDPVEFIVGDVVVSVVDR